MRLFNMRRESTIIIWYIFDKICLFRWISVRRSEKVGRERIISVIDFKQVSWGNKDDPVRGGLASTKEQKQSYVPVFIQGKNKTISYILLVCSTLIMRPSNMIHEALFSSYSRWIQKLTQSVFLVLVYRETNNILQTLFNAPINIYRCVIRHDKWRFDSLVGMDEWKWKVEISTLPNDLSMRHLNVTKNKPYVSKKKSS